jgi:energy-coupling factor transporter ATP-binding protein EcfA2
MAPLIRINEMQLKSGYTIKGVELEIGSSLAVIGRAGSGKTEFCLKFLEEHHYFLWDTNPEKYCEEIGYIPSNPLLLFSGMKTTLRGEIEMSLQFLGHPHKEVMEIAKLFEVDHLLNRNVFTLSGGEAIKAAFAIVGIKKPKVWILDQIYDWLHPDTRDTIRNALKNQLLYVNLKPPIFIETHSHAPKWIHEFTTCIFFDRDFTLTSGLFESIESEINDKYLLGANYESGNATVDMHIVNSIYNKDQYENDVTQDKNIGLSVNNLQYAYDPKGYSIGPITVTIPEGSSAALMGPNGVGKTTLMKNLALILSPQYGSVLINGKVAEMVPYKRPREIFYCFQNPDDQLFLPSVKEELMYTFKNLRRDEFKMYGQLLKEKLDQLLMRLELSDFADHDPLTIPASYKRMVLFAAGIFAWPAVLLLDEPTAGLDGFQKSLLVKEIHSFCHNGGICIFVSHDFSFIEAVSTVKLYMDSGKGLMVV